MLRGFCYFYFEISGGCWEQTLNFEHWASVVTTRSPPLNKIQDLLESWQAVETEAELTPETSEDSVHRVGRVP
jgi:hypothetical protein